MPVRCACPHCAMSMTLPDDLLGRHMKCPQCLKEFSVQPEGPKPASAKAAIVPKRVAEEPVTRVVTQCEHCLREMRIREKLVGRSIACPSCGRDFTAKARMRKAKEVKNRSDLFPVGKPANNAVNPLPRSKPAARNLPTETEGDALTVEPASVYDAEPVESYSDGIGIKRHRDERRRPVPRTPPPRRQDPPKGGKGLVVGMLIAIGFVGMAIMFFIVLTMLGLGSSWREFDCPQGRFKVMMPGTPKKVKASAKNPDAHTWQLMSRGREFLVSCKDEPNWTPPHHIEEDPNYLLARDGMVQQLKGSLAYDQSATLGGKPAREWMVDAPSNTKVMVRFSYVNGRLYIVTMTARNLTAQSEDANKYFNSFQFR